MGTELNTAMMVATWGSHKLTHCTEAACDVACDLNCLCSTSSQGQGEVRGGGSPGLRGPAPQGVHWGAWRLREGPQPEELQNSFQRCVTCCPSTPTERRLGQVQSDGRSAALHTIHLTAPQDVSVKWISWVCWEAGCVQFLTCDGACDHTAPAAATGLQVQEPRVLLRRQKTKHRGSQDTGTCKGACLTCKPIRPSPTQATTHAGRMRHAARRRPLVRPQLELWPPKLWNMAHSGRWLSCLLP